MIQQLIDSISVTGEASVDLTHHTDYGRLVAEEIDHYSGIEVKEDLTEGGIHGFKAWDYNYEYLKERIHGTTFWIEVANHANLVDNPRLLSLGCGYGGVDLRVAQKLRRPFELIAVDLNPTIFREALSRAKAEQWNISFKCVDLNFVEIQPASFDVIYAFASLHHVLNLEHLFSAIHRGLKDGGRLVILDIIGQTQVLHWKENVEFAAEVIRKMPRRYRPGNASTWRNWRQPFDPYSIIARYTEPSDQVGMEGIRQEEIEPLLDRWFKAEKAFRYNAFIRLICTNPHLGALLDPCKKADRRFLDRLIALDRKLVQSGKLRPTELLGVYAKR